MKNEEFQTYQHSFEVSYRILHHHTKMKVFELLIIDQIVEHLNRNKILTTSQYGFRKKYSTTDALMYCTEFIRNEINQKRSVASAFLDLSKAFDSIDHTVLNQKLVEVGFNTNACKLLSSFYMKDRKLLSWEK